MRSGITPVIATVILLMMTVAIAGGAFFWISSLQSRAQQGVGTQASTTSTRTAFNAQMISLEINPEADYLNATVFNNNQRTIPSGAMAYTIINEQQEIIKTVISELTSSIDYGEFKTLSVNIGEGVIGNKTYTVKVTFSDGTTAIGDTVAGSTRLCGNNVCESGETPINCYIDCGIHYSIIQHENYNGVDDAIIMLELIINEDEISFGNRSIIYNPGGELTDSEQISLDNNKFFAFWKISDQLEYVYHDGIQLSTVNQIPQEHNIEEPRGQRERNNAHLLFINCTNWDANCDLIYFNWSINNGFSEFEKITNLNQNNNQFYDDGDSGSPFFSVSNNGNYRLATWIDSGIINYTLSTNGQWSEIITLINDASVSDIKTAKVNNQGEIIIIYINNSINEIMHYDGISWEKISNELFASSQSIKSEVLDDSFMIVFNSGNYFNSTILNNKIYLNNQLITNELALMVFPVKMRHDYIVGMLVKTNGFGTTFIYDNIDNSWKNEIPLTLSGMGISYCQKYERFSGECATEVYCNDIVDNDEDGLVDCADTDCSSDPACN